MNYPPCSLTFLNCKTSGCEKKNPNSSQTTFLLLFCFVFVLNTSFNSSRTKNELKNQKKNPSGPPELVDVLDDIEESGMGQIPTDQQRLDARRSYQLNIKYPAVSGT